LSHWRSHDQNARTLLDRGAAGITVQRQRTIDVTRRLDEVTLDDVAVPSSPLQHAGGAAEAALSHQNR
jgi:hypothetical protein